MSALDRTHTGVVADPATGEVIDLATATTDALAAYLANVRDLEHTLREQKKAAQGEVLRRMDSEATWTVRVGDWKLTGASPAPKVVYDAEGLQADLQQLAADDLVAPAAVDRAVETVTSLRISQAGINSLVKLGGAVAEVVARHRREEPRDRRVSVSRRGVE